MDPFQGHFELNKWREKSVAVFKSDTYQLTIANTSDGVTSDSEPAQLSTPLKSGTNWRWLPGKYYHTFQIKIAYFSEIQMYMAVAMFT